jgi:hypothetical protein
MLALELIKNPPSPEKHFKRHASSIMLSIIYDLPPVDSEDDPVVVAINEHVDRILFEVQPGSRLVEFFPWMKYIPSRFAKWKRDAQYWYIQDSLMFERLLGKVADELVRARFAIVVFQEMYHNYQRREKGLIGQASVLQSSKVRVNTVFQNASRHGSWVTCCALSNLCCRSKLKSNLSSISVLRVKRQRPLRSIGGFSLCSRILMSKPGPMPSSTRS